MHDPNFNILYASDIDEDDAEDMLAYDCQREVLLFYKYYDPAKRMIYYMGHSIEHIMSKFSKKCRSACACNY